MMKVQTGMTYQEALDHDRGQINLQLYVNIALGVVYLGLWWWARKNPLVATVSALLLFVTVIAVNAFVDAKTLGQGLLIKIAVLSVLGGAVGAALKARALQKA
jgi:hypothetical protein